MKKYVIFLFCLFLSIAVFGQNETKNELEGNVVNPRFTGSENVTSILKTDNSLMVNKYLKENLVCPKKAVECFIEGTEIVQFVVTPAGELTNFRVTNSLCPEIDEELIRVLKETNGMWEPGLKNGTPIAMEQEVKVMIGDYTDDTFVKYFTQKAENHFINGSKKLFEQNNPKKALKHYNMAARYLPNDKSLLLLRGICHYDLGDDEKAEKDWNRIVALGGIDIEKTEYDLVGMKGFAKMSTILAKNK